MAVEAAGNQQTTSVCFFSEEIKASLTCIVKLVIPLSAFVIVI